MEIKFTPTQTTETQDGTVMSHITVDDKHVGWTIRCEGGFMAVLGSYQGYATHFPVLCANIEDAEANARNHIETVPYSAPTDLTEARRLNVMGELGTQEKAA